MFEAGRTNLFALCWKTIWPVSSETILTAKKPGSSTGCRTISSIRVCKSARLAGAGFSAGSDLPTTGAPGPEGIGEADGDPDGRAGTFGDSLCAQTVSCGNGLMLSVKPRRTAYSLEIFIVLNPELREPRRWPCPVFPPR